tara:strand:- start:362 stop:802 length:441 start_codon:yes stop_codon:yes gene_type:complete
MKKIIILLLSIISLCLILITFKLYIPENFLNFKNFNNFITTARQKIQYASFGDEWWCVEDDTLKAPLSCDSRNAGGSYPFFTGFAYNIPTKKIDFPWGESYPSLNFCKKRMKFLAEKDVRNWWSKPYGCIIHKDEDTRIRVYYREN